MKRTYEDPMMDSRSNIVNLLFFFRSEIWQRFNVQILFQPFFPSRSPVPKLSTLKAAGKWVKTYEIAGMPFCLSQSCKTCPLVTDFPLASVNRFAILSRTGSSASPGNRLTGVRPPNDVATILYFLCNWITGSVALKTYGWYSTYHILFSKCTAYVCNRYGNTPDW